MLEPHQLVQCPPDPYKWSGWLLSFIGESFSHFPDQKLGHVEQYLGVVADHPEVVNVDSNGYYKNQIHDAEEDPE